VVLPAFGTGPFKEQLIPGQAKSYVLPLINDGTYPLLEITITGSVLGPYLSIDSTLRTMEYNGGFN